MSEIADACQIVMISGRMIAVSADLSLKMALLMLKIYNSLYLGKWKGKTNFQRFRAIKGDDYEFINICSEDNAKLAIIEKEMEAHNLLFARLPDLCGGDGNTQYVIARSDISLFTAFLMDHVHGELHGVKVGPITESDYAKTAVHPESDTYTKEFEELNRTAEDTREEKREKSDTLSKQSPDKTFPAQKSGKINETASDPGGEEKDSLMITRYGEREEAALTDLINDPQVRLREEALRRRDKMEVIFDPPIREEEKWAAFPVHDGFHVVVIPKEDLLSGNTARKWHYRAEPIEKLPTAMLFAGKNYVVMDLKSGEKSVRDGQSVIDMLKVPSLEKQKESLVNLASNIEKNAGKGAVLPTPAHKRSGR